MGLGNVFFKKLGEKLPEDTAKKADEVEEVLNRKVEPVAETKIEEAKPKTLLETLMINIEPPVPAETVIEFAEKVEEPVVAKEVVNNTIEVAATVPVEEDVKPAEEPKELVTDPITEVAEELKVEEAVAVEDVVEIPAVEEPAVTVVSQDNTSVEYEVRPEIAKEIQDIIENASKNAVREIIELIRRNI